MRRDGMQQVELLEHDEQDAHASGDEVDRARRAAGARARAGWEWVRDHRRRTTAVVAVVVVAIVVPVAVSGVVSARAEQARVARLAEMPDVLVPLAQAPQITWQSDAAMGLAALNLPGHAWIRDGVLVVWDQGSEAESLHAVDARTGDPLWETVLTTRPETGGQDGVSIHDPTTCTAPASGVVVCLVADGWTTSQGIETRVDGVDAGPGTFVEPESMRLRAFRVADGRMVLDRAVTDLASLLTRGRDIVLAQTPDGQVSPATVERLDPLTGTTRWTTTIPRGAGTAGLMHAIVHLLGGQIAVSWEGSTQVFTDEGQPSQRYGTDDVWDVRGHALTFGGGLRDAETSRRLGPPETYPAMVSLDDGSAPDLMLVQDDTALRAVDITTGDTAWKLSTPTYASATMLVADGAVAMLVNGALEVRDLRTGASLWRLSTRELRGESMVTDGRHLIVLTPGHRRNVTAYGLRDGRRAWNVEPPTSIESLAVVDRRLFGHGGGVLVAFGPGQPR
jgi:outer membrane protein assembly factor BamB